MEKSADDTETVPTTTSASSSAAASPVASAEPVAKAKAAKSNSSAAGCRGLRGRRLGGQEIERLEAEPGGGGRLPGSRRLRHGGRFGLRDRWFLLGHRRKGRHGHGRLAALQELGAARDLRAVDRARRRPP